METGWTTLTDENGDVRDGVGDRARRAQDEHRYALPSCPVV